MKTLQTQLSSGVQNKTITNFITENRVVKAAVLIKSITNNTVTVENVTTLNVSVTGTSTPSKAIKALQVEGFKVNLVYSSNVEQDAGIYSFRMLCTFDAKLDLAEFTNVSALIHTALPDNLDNRTDVRILDHSGIVVCGNTVNYINYETTTPSDVLAKAVKATRVNRAYKNNVSAAKYTLKAGQKLSDLDINLDDVFDKLVQADTGSGKTYFAVNKIEGKKILLLPSINSTIEVANSYKGKSFNQFNKDVSNEDNLITCTYASFPLLASIVDIAQFTIVVDEAHCLTTNAAQSFMGAQINSMIEILQKRIQMNTVLISATPIRSCHPFLLSFGTTVVHSEETMSVSYKDSRVKDTEQFLKATATKAKANNNFLAIFMNNKSEKLDSLLGLLKDFDYDAFNSDTKNSANFAKMSLTGIIRNDSDGFFSTTVLKEATSLYFETPRAVEVIVIGSFSASDIKQFVSRFRNATNIIVTIVRNAEFVSKECNYQPFRDESLMLGAAEKNATYFNSCITSENPYSVAMAETVNQFKATYCKTQDSFVSVDFTTISNAIYDKETKSVWADLELLSERMSEYGWSYTGLSDYTLELNKTDKEELMAAKKDAKEAKKVMKESLLTKIATEGLEANKVIVEKGCEDIVGLEEEMRYRLNYLYVFEKNEDKVFEVFAEVGKSKLAWSKFEKQLLVRRVHTDSLVTGRIDSKFIESIYSKISVDQVLTPEMVLEIFTETMKKELTYKSVGKLTTRKAMNMLTWFFEVDSKSVNTKDEDGNNAQKEDGSYIKHKAYTITSNNPLALNINTDETRDLLSGKTKKVSAEINFGLFA